MISYSAAIGACEKGDQWDRAMSSLREIRRSPLELDVTRYSAAISACEKGGTQLQLTHAGWPPKGGCLWEQVVRLPERRVCNQRVQDGRKICRPLGRSSPRSSSGVTRRSSRRGVCALSACEMALYLLPDNTPMRRRFRPEPIVISYSAAIGAYATHTTR